MIVETARGDGRSAMFSRLSGELSRMCGKGVVATDEADTLGPISRAAWSSATAACDLAVIDEGEHLGVGIVVTELRVEQLRSSPPDGYDVGWEGAVALPKGSLVRRRVSGGGVVGRQHVRDHAGDVVADPCRRLRQHRCASERQTGGARLGP